MQENKLAYARFLLLIGTIWPFLVWLIFRYTVPFFHEAVSKVTDTASFFTYTKQNFDFPKPELCHVPDFLYLWT